jgi:hypothetical protein
MKKYIIYSSLTNVLFPLVMFYPLFFLGLFIPNPLFVLANIVGTDAVGFGIALLIWLIIGGVVGFGIYKFRQNYYSKKSLPIPLFGFMGLLLSIIAQLLITYTLLYVS